MLTVSKFMNILKDLPGDIPIVIVKDASDNRDDGCYYVTEVAKMHTDYKEVEKQDAVGLSMSQNTIEYLSSNFDHTVWSEKGEKDG